MNRNGSRITPERGAKVISSVKHRDDPLSEASQALRKALVALSTLEVTNPIQPLDLAPGINFYAEVSRFEIRLIRYALMKTGGRQTHAASLLGLKVTTLNAKIKAYRINWRSAS